MRAENKKASFLKWFLFPLIVFMGACNNSSNNPSEIGTPFWTPEVTNEWTVSRPEDNGINEGLLTQAYARASGLSHLKSLLVVKNGDLVAEGYFQGLNQNDMHDVRSVTKTVIATLTGIALEKGYLESLDQTIDSYFVEEYADLPPEKRAITIRHILTMTSGFMWDESDASDYTAWANSLDPIAFVLNRPLVSDPGQTFRYNSGTVHLLSVILTKATGLPTLDFANQVLFEPMGFGPLFWERLARGYYNGGAGLDLRPRDMAKLGKLFLDGGVWNGQEILGSAWIEQAMQPTRQSSGNYGPLSNIDYGFLWWLAEAGNTPLQLAWGWGGQFITTFPQNNLVVIATSNWNVDTLQANSQEVQNLELIVESILPAVQ